MKKVVATKKAAGAIGPYSQAIIAGGLVFTSGQMGKTLDGVLPEGVEAQAKQALKNVKAILEAAGSDMDKIIKTTVFITDMDNFAKVNAIYATFFTEGTYPARSCVEVSRLPGDCLVEVEAVALL